MKIFESRKSLFDLEKYKGKGSNPIQDDKLAMKGVTSSQLQDYKFKLMQQKYGSEQLSKNFEKNEN